MDRNFKICLAEINTNPGSFVSNYSKIQDGLEQLQECDMYREGFIEKRKVCDFSQTI